MTSQRGWAAAVVAVGLTAIGVAAGAVMPRGRVQRQPPGELVAARRRRLAQQRHDRGTRLGNVLGHRCGNRLGECAAIEDRALIGDTV